MARTGLGAVTLATLTLTLTAAAASAQTIGSFSWQTQPYCNVITMTVIQQGGLYQLIGSDNLCGAGTAPVTGTAVPAGANVAFGLTASLPAGRAAHVSATIGLGNLSGTWSDADGNTGAFAFGATAPGTPRPLPAPSLPRTALGPRGLIAQAEVLESSAFRFSRSSNGQTLTVSRPFLGTALVVFPGFAGAPGGEYDQTVQVTSTFQGRLCVVANRFTEGTQLTVQVTCTTTTNLAADTPFFITVTS